MIVCNYSNVCRVLDQGAVGGAISAERGSMQLLCFNLSAADPGSAESLLHIYQFPNDYAQAGLADLVVDLHHNFVYIRFSCHKTCYLIYNNMFAFVSCIMLSCVIAAIVVPPASLPHPSMPV